MRKLVLVASLVVLALATGCLQLGGVVGSGKLATRDMDLSGFSRVDAGGTFVVDIVRSDSYGVAITADDNLFSYLDVAVAGDTLRLGLRGGYSFGQITVKARVAMPSLRGVSLSGASRGTVTGFQSSEDLAVDLSGASTLRGDVQAGDTRVETSGAGSLALSGSGGDLSLSGSGGSRADLPDFAVRDADVNLSGGSSATIRATGRLDADLSGGSRLECAGNPTLGRVDTSGGATISQR